MRSETITRITELGKELTYLNSTKILVPLSVDRHGIGTLLEG